MHDDVEVLAAERGELAPLLIDARGSGVENCLRARRERPHVGLRRGADDVALRGNELAGERVLERRQPASSQQRVVAVHLRHQRLLRRHGEHLRGADTENRCARFDLPVDFRVDLGHRLQIVPEAVDLVENDDAAGLRCGIIAGEVLRPHVEIGLRDAGVGGEDEQHRVRVGQQIERELGLRSDRIQSRRVEDHESLLQ